MTISLRFLNWFAFLCLCASVLSSTVSADVRFIHDYSLDEYLLGKQKTVLDISYVGDGLYIDKVERLTGSLMKKFFGKEKEEHSTIHILLDKDMIREFDYYKSKIYNYPLEKLGDIELLRTQADERKEMNEFLAERYSVREPVFSLEILPGTFRESGYDCTRVEVILKLETDDKKKHARSITDVRQTLWVSGDVPGYDEYAGFHRRLATRMGLEAERLGPLTYTLIYWKGSLEAIHDKLVLVSGYPVRSEVRVTGSYVEHTDTPNPRTSTMEIKTETMVLKSVSTDPIDPVSFIPKEPFGVVTVK